MRALLQSRSFRRWAVANLFARLPLTMQLLALVLAGEAATGSLAVGAQLAGVATVATGAAGLWRGRQLDLRDLRSGLQRHLLAGAAGMAAIAVAVALEAPVPVLFAVAIATAVASAAVLGGFRALLVPAIERDQLPQANALDAVFVEVAFVSGPAVAGVLALVVGPVAVLGVMGAALVVAAVLIRGLPTRAAPEAGLVGTSPLRTPGARSLYAFWLLAGVPLGFLDATMPARAAELGLDAAVAGPLLAFTAAGSGLAGVIAAATHKDPLRRPRILGAALFGAFALLILPVSVVGSVVALAVALFALGTPIAPLNALGSLVMQHTLPPDRRAEGFTLLTSAILIGAGAGQALSGVLLTRASPGALMAAAATIPAALALTLVVAAARRNARGLPQAVAPALE